MRNRGELRGPQTHRLWVAAEADLLETLHGGPHPGHSPSLSVSLSWLPPGIAVWMSACAHSLAVLLPRSRPLALPCPAAPS